MADNDENLSDVILETMSKDLQEEFKKAKKVYEEALFFLKRIEIISNNNNWSLVSNDSLLGLKTIMHEKQNDLKNLIDAQYRFEDAVNDFLDREISFVYMTEDGTPLFATGKKAISFYTSAVPGSSDYKGKIQLTKTQKGSLKGLKKFFKDSDFIERVDQKLRDHQGLYTEILRRFDINADSKREYFKSKDYDRTIWWRIPPSDEKPLLNKMNENETKYQWTRNFPNRGHVVENYLNFIFNSKADENYKYLGENDEPQLGSFLIRHMRDADRVPGIVKGDIELDVNGENIHLAVKSGIFDTASIGPYISTAYQIVELFHNANEGGLSPESLKARLKDLKMYNQKVTLLGRLKTQEIFEETIKKHGGLLTAREKQKLQKVQIP